MNHKLVRRCLWSIALAGLSAYGGSEPGAGPPQWSNDQVAVVGGAGDRVSVAGTDCLVADQLRFDVLDGYAFDIDETVWLDADFYAGSESSKVGVLYARGDGPAPNIGLLIDAKHRSIPEISLPKENNARWRKVSIALERARFANSGTFGSEDFALYSLADGNSDRRRFTLCNISLRRSHTTPVLGAFGRIAMEVLDENGHPTAARVGLYDSSGRMPLPSDRAVALRTVGDVKTRIVGLGYGVPSWPTKNRSVFYIDGRYDARLPATTYELVVGKGPEYRLVRRRFTVRADSTSTLTIRLRRWTDMAAQGWYSGEGHIHYTRADAQDDRELQSFIRAEDLRVANILQVGDSATSAYFHQYVWKPVPPDANASFVLVAGQEDPRTTRLGHSMQLNIRGPVRDTGQYLLYYKTFEKVRAEGGLTGFAHVVEPGWGEPVTEARGMAIDVPFGLVDFAEILVFHHAGGEAWFDFLNLGFKLTPAAGSDYPAGVVPGAVRNYVAVDRPFTTQGWFDGFRQGRTFVTNGPMLQMEINGQGMGSEIHLRRGEPLVIKAEASINPDVDVLSSLELIEQGDSLREISPRGGARKIELRADLKAKNGTWFVVRARGRNPNVVAISAPIYVLVDGERFWKRDAVPSIVARMKRKLQGVLESEQTEMTGGGEAFARHWDAQKSQLEQRVQKAEMAYDELARSATIEPKHP